MQAQNNGSEPILLLLSTGKIARAGSAIIRLQRLSMDTLQQNQRFPEITRFGW